MHLFKFKKKYHVSLDEIDYLKPEETLHDISAISQKIEKPIGRSSFRIFLILFSLISLFYLFIVFRLQILDGNKSLGIIKSSSAGRFFNAPVRGVIYDRDGQAFVENIPSFNLIALTSELARLDDTARRDNFNKLSQIIDIDGQTLVDLYQKNKKNMTFIIKGDLEKEEVLQVENSKSPGIYVNLDARRHYDGISSAHLIGYTSKVSSNDIKNDSYYGPNDRIGKYGLEAKYDSFLRGEKRPIVLGGDFTLVDNARPGNDLYLNVDGDIQNKLYEALVGVGVQRGAAIAQDPRTGAVLGLVSMPTFDSNIFEDGKPDALKKILDNRQRPLFNRVISGRYSPGSTIKPLLALAGLEEGVVTPDTKIVSEGFISIPSVFDSSVIYTFKDWKVHGLTDLRKAISDSVDVYFYALGGGYRNIKGLGVDKIVQYFKKFLLDKPTGIDLLGEVSGFIPSPEWKEKTKGERWLIGDTYNISIGQGDLLVTPVWLNAYLGAIANSGKIMKPYIVQKIVSPDGQPLQEYRPQVLGEVVFSEDTIRVIREGMRQTVTSGTAQSLNTLPVAVAAKTGTAQVTGRGLNSLFVVYGPYEDPTISLTVLVEDIGNNQGLAMRVANQFLSWYFAPTAPSPGTSVDNLTN